MKWFSNVNNIDRMPLVMDGNINSAYDLSHPTKIIFKKYPIYDNYMKGKVNK